MARKTYHVTKAKKGDRWKVKVVGKSKTVSTRRTKDAAVTEAKDLAKAAGKGHVVIHGQDGKIQKEHTYGKDPNPPKG